MAFNPLIIASIPFPADQMVTTAEMDKIAGDLSNTSETVLTAIGTRFFGNTCAIAVIRSASVTGVYGNIEHITNNMGISDKNIKNAAEDA